MPAPATVSVRRADETQMAVEPVADLQTATGADHDQPTVWHPLSEQSLLAALATLTMAT